MIGGICHVLTSNYMAQHVTAATQPYQVQEANASDPFAVHGILARITAEIRKPAKLLDNTTADSVAGLAESDKADEEEST